MPRLHRPHLAALVAAVLLLTGLGAAMHGHVPARDGWDAPSGDGVASHHEGLSSCSICRLAHETSVAPTAPGVVSTPLPFHVPHTTDPSGIVRVFPTREHSPRAPPCLASC